jgi:ELWxxDGT repeat protein
MFDTTNGIVRTVADPSIMASTDPKFLTYKDGEIYFGGYKTLSFDNNGVEYAGIELWKYNIASQKATVVDNIARGVRQDSDPFWMLEANGMLYFGVSTPYNGRELWKSDGETPSIPLGNFNAGTGNFLPNKLNTYTSNNQAYDVDYSYTTILKTTW